MVINSNKKPHLIDLGKIGSNQEGFISVAELQNALPFEAKRTFWTYATPADVVRGKHAHFVTEQVLIALSGQILVDTESPEGLKKSFLLKQPNIGLYLPPDHWHTMRYSRESVQLVFASTPYNEKDYIRKYEEFRAIYSKKNLLPNYK